MRRRTFERLVRRGIAEIPRQFQRYLADIPVVIEAEPSLEQKRTAGIPSGTELLGLYEGTPRTERMYLPHRLPDKVTLFQGPFERLCGGDTECIRQEVARTVWHELGHALGMSERRIRSVERARFRPPSPEAPARLRRGLPRRVRDH